MSDTSLELETLLREKEELIDALTERLELTAEQLDRMQRAGGDRGHWLSGGVPAELVEQQQTLCEDLERVVQQWEETQPGAALGRIEMQLNELRDLLVQLPSGGGRQYDEPRRRVEAEGSAEEASSGPVGWEALKAGLLGENPPADDGHVADDRPSSAHDVARDDGPDPFDGESLNPPEPIDVDTAEAETLRSAVLTRDEFISELLRRLRAAETRTRPTDGWKALESVPDELKNRLESLERRLEQTLRTSEVAISLERAKLGREAARLKQLEETTQKAMERIGYGLAEQDRDDDSDDEQPENAADGRWLRMLGIKREK